MKTKKAILTKEVHLLKKVLKTEKVLKQGNQLHKKIPTGETATEKVIAVREIKKATVVKEIIIQNLQTENKVYIYNA
jgi:hypothetical protein